MRYRVKARCVQQSGQCPTHARVVVYDRNAETVLRHKGILAPNFASGRVAPSVNAGSNRSTKLDRVAPNTHTRCHLHELRDRPHAHFAHHSAAMDLNRLLARPEVVRNLLVQSASHDVSEHFALTPG